MCSGYFSKFCFNMTSTICAETCTNADVESNFNNFESHCIITIRSHGAH